MISVLGAFRTAGILGFRLVRVYVFSANSPQLKKRRAANLKSAARLLVSPLHAGQNCLSLEVLAVQIIGGRVEAPVGVRRGDARRAIEERPKHEDRIGQVDGSIIVGVGGIFAI